MKLKDLKESSTTTLTNDVILEIKSDVPDFSLWDYNKICEYLQTEEQTPEICLAAVQHHGYALRYVKEQTPEICLAAVKQTGYVLQYVKEQTPEICIAAVKQDGDALQYVEEHIKQSTEFQDQLITMHFSL